MDKETTEAQWVEVLEWCGLKFGWHPRIRRPAYQTPDREWHFGKPDFDLNFLFKWAVPKLTRYDLWCDVIWDGERKVHGEKHYALAQLGEHTEVVGVILLH